MFSAVQEDKYAKFMKFVKSLVNYGNKEKKEYHQIKGCKIVTNKDIIFT